MVEKTELILICLVAVALLAIVARKIRVPYPILLTIGGVVLALVPGLPAIHLDPQLVFNLFLPPFLYLVPFRSGRRDDRRLFAGASELAIPFCRRGRHLCRSRRGLAGNAIAKAFGRSASANNVLPAYAVRCLLQRRKAACLRNPRS